MAFALEVSYEHEVFSKTDEIPGRTLYVGGTGPGNYSRIQDAIDNSTHGDTVFVYSGKKPYDEHLIIDTAITLIGQEKNSTIIDSQLDSDVITICHSNVVLSNFTITNTFSGHSFADGIVIENVDTVDISNCNISNNQKGGIYIFSSQCIVLANNLIGSNGQTGLKMDDSQDIHIIGNDITHNPSHGTCVSHCQNIFLECNNITSNKGRGILFSYDVHNSKIHSNIISHNGEDGIFLQDRCTHTDISNNIILENDEKGILMKSESHNNSIINNRIEGNNQDYFHSSGKGGGISIYDSFDTMIAHNIIRYNTHEELFLAGALRSCILYNSIYDKLPNRYSADLHLDTCYNSKISHNNFRQGVKKIVTIEFHTYGEIKELIQDIFKMRTVKIFDNFWKRPRMVPKTIGCLCYFNFGHPTRPRSSVVIPNMLFDIKPSIIPNRVACNLKNDSNFHLTSYFT